MKLSPLTLLTLCECLVFGAEFKKHVQNSVYPYDADPPSYNIGSWVNQLHLQQCAFVAVGDKYYAIFAESRPRRYDSEQGIKEYFIGLCDDETLRKWALCAPALHQLRPNDCNFESKQMYGSRVHRRLCDLTLLANKAPQCDCTADLSDEKLYQVQGFPTCFKPPLPESLCGDNNVCGLAACSPDTINKRIHTIRCDRKGSENQPFCEGSNKASAMPRKIDSFWTDWSNPFCTDVSCLSQFDEAVCINRLTKRGDIDCLGPGTSCCTPDLQNCRCHVYDEDGTLKVFRTFTMPQPELVEYMSEEDFINSIPLRYLTREEYHKYPYNSPRTVRSNFGRAFKQTLDNIYESFPIKIGNHINKHSKGLRNVKKSLMKPYMNMEAKDNKEAAKSEVLNVHPVTTTVKTMPTFSSTKTLPPTETTILISDNSIMQLNNYVNYKDSESGGFDGNSKTEVLRSVNTNGRKHQTHIHKYAPQKKKCVKIKRELLKAYGIRALPSKHVDYEVDIIIDRNTDRSDTSDSSELVAELEKTLQQNNETVEDKEAGVDITENVLKLNLTTEDAMQFLNDSLQNISQTYPSASHLTKMPEMFRTPKKSMVPDRILAVSKPLLNSLTLNDLVSLYGITPSTVSFSTNNPYLEMEKSSEAPETTGVVDIPRPTTFRQKIVPANKMYNSIDSQQPIKKSKEKATILDDQDPSKPTETPETTDIVEIPRPTTFEQQIVPVNKMSNSIDSQQPFEKYKEKTTFRDDQDPSKHTETPETADIVEIPRPTTFEQQIVPVNKMSNSIDSQQPFKKYKAKTTFLDDQAPSKHTETPETTDIVEIPRPTTFRQKIDPANKMSNSIDSQQPFEKYKEKTTILDDQDPSKHTETPETTDTVEIPRPTTFEQNSVPVNKMSNSMDSQQPFQKYKEKTTILDDQDPSKHTETAESTDIDKITRPSTFKQRIVPVNKMFNSIVSQQPFKKSKEKTTFLDDQVPSKFFNSFNDTPIATKVNLNKNPKNFDNLQHFEFIPLRPTSKKLKDGAVKPTIQRFPNGLIKHKNVVIDRKKKGFAIHRILGRKATTPMFLPEYRPTINEDIYQSGMLAPKTTTQRFFSSTIPIKRENEASYYVDEEDIEDIAPKTSVRSIIEYDDFNLETTTANLNFPITTVAQRHSGNFNYGTNNKNQLNRHESGNANSDNTRKYLHARRKNVNYLVAESFKKKILARNTPDLYENYYNSIITPRNYYEDFDSIESVKVPKSLENTEIPNVSCNSNNNIDIGIIKEDDVDDLFSFEEKTNSNAISDDENDGAQISISTSTESATLNGNLTTVTDSKKELNSDEDLHDSAESDDISYNDKRKSDVGINKDIIEDQDERLNDASANIPPHSSVDEDEDMVRKVEETAQALNINLMRFRKQAPQTVEEVVDDDYNDEEDIAIEYDGQIKCEFCNLTTPKVPERGEHKSLNFKAELKQLGDNNNSKKPNASKSSDATKNSNYFSTPFYIILLFIVYF